MGAAPVQVLPGVSYFGTMGGDAMHSYISGATAGTWLC